MDYEEDKQSKFNAGIALTERLDSLQRAINAARFNPILKNFETGTYNYEIMICSCDGLLNEAWDKLSPAEKTFAQRLTKVVHEMKELFPPIEVDDRGNTRINNTHYKKMLVVIDFYEKKMKEWLGRHNLNAPNKDEDEDYDY
jgi:hypothetical protein